LNLLDLVASFKRQVGTYARTEDTDSTLAAYLADAIEALDYRWTREYAITFTAPNSYAVSPTIEVKDKRPIILMASIIYKMGKTNLASFRDGDFAWDPAQGRSNPIGLDVTELDRYLGSAGPRLAQGITAPLRGYSNIFNPESYRFILTGRW
jgi:hypothetical protein